MSLRSINIKDCLIEIRDGDSHKITIKIAEGNLTYDEKRNMEYKLDRGKLDTVQEGDEAPMEVKIDAQWDFITGDASTAPITIEDALKQTGGAAEWVTTDEDECNPYAVDIVVFYQPPCTGAVAETITFPDFRYEQLSHDLKNASLSLGGKCNVTQATAVRGAISS